MWSIVKGSFNNNDSLEEEQEEDDKTLEKLTDEQKSSAIKFSEDFIEKAGNFGFYEDISKIKTEDLLELYKIDEVTKLTKTRSQVYEELDIPAKSPISLEEPAESLDDETEILALSSFSVNDLKVEFVEAVRKGQGIEVLMNVFYESVETVRFVSFSDITGNGNLSVIESRIPVAGNIVLSESIAGWDIKSVTIDSPHTLAIFPFSSRIENMGNGVTIVDKDFYLEVEKWSEN